MGSSKTPRPSLARRVFRDLLRAPAPVWDLPGQDGTFGQEVVGESLHQVQFARLLRQDPQVDALWRARADDGGIGTISNTVRLDLAPLEVVTAQYAAI